MGTANILNAIKNKFFVKSCVLITTDKVYENKEWIWPYRENDALGGYDPYSSSKACAEILIKSFRNSYFNIDNFNKSHNTLIASARAGNVIGGGDWANDRLMTDIIRNIFEKNKEICIRSPKAIRPWQHVLEPLYGYLLLAKKLHEGEVMFSDAWNFGPSEENFISVEELVEKGIEIIRRGNYVVENDASKHEARTLKLDSTKAKEYLDWNPYLDIDEILKWSFEWYNCFYKNNKDIVNFTNKQIKLFFREK